MAYVPASSAAAAEYVPLAGPCPLARPPVHSPLHPHPPQVSTWALRIKSKEAVAQLLALLEYHKAAAAATTAAPAAGEGKGEGAV